MYQNSVELISKAKDKLLQGLLLRREFSYNYIGNKICIKCRIIASLMLEKTSKITKFNPKPPPSCPLTMRLYDISPQF